MNAGFHGPASPALKRSDRGLSAAATDKTPQTLPSSTGTKRPSIDFHVEELRLVGFRPADRYIVGNALQNELARLLGESDSELRINREVELEHIDLGSIKITPGASALAIGAQLAAAIFKMLPR